MKHHQAYDVNKVDYWFWVGEGDLRRAVVPRRGVWAEGVVISSPRIPGISLSASCTSKWLTDYPTTIASLSWFLFIFTQD